MKSLNVLHRWIVLFVLCAAGTNAYAQLTVFETACEYRLNPIGIDEERPRLSWKLSSDANNVKQAAYEIRISNTSNNLLNGNNINWESGKVESDNSTHVIYGGPSLKSMQRIYWQVRVWDNLGRVSPWSKPAFWEMGLLDTNDWQASWITKNEEESTTSLPAQYYRREFSLQKQIESARVYVTSLGIYQLFLNGQKVGNQLFTPGYTSYSKRIQYQTYEVTNMLQKENAIGALVGDGWYRGYIGWQGDKAYYGDQLALLVQLKINYTDGTSEVVASDQSWKVSYGAILESDIYNGEIYDANLQMQGWNESGFKDKKWEDVAVLDFSKDVLVASNSVPIAITEEIKAKEIIKTPKGELVVDLGQNIVGNVRMRVEGGKGDVIKLQYAEVLDKDGNFYTKNLRSAKATDTYTLNGDGIEVYQPYFTFHGFRYIKLIGYPGELSKEDITGLVIHSDMEETGSFSCSNALINQLQSNIRWGQRCNFLDIPTDCPQRDERVGWTGDTQIFSSTAAFNYQVAPFFTKWLKDLALDQQENGEVPNIVPDMWNNKLGGCAGWGDAAVIVPWTLYLAYGDQQILEEQYQSMSSWISYLEKRAGSDLLINDNKHQWGDWLPYRSDKGNYVGAQTEGDLVATAYFYYSTTILADISRILKKTNEAIRLDKLSSNIKDAFANEYITPKGRLVSNTQTAYSMALSFGLIPDNLRNEAVRFLAADVKKFGHLTTGFLGTPLLCKTLADNGREDLAFMLLNRKEYPSWLYPVTMGATTIWERWDTQKPDGTIIEGMNSFNHYAYGAIGEWLYNYVAGLSIDKNNPGYKKTIFSPNPGGELTHATATINSMYGLIESAWKVEDGNLIYQLQIPPNTEGVVVLPKATGKKVLLNNQLLSEEVSSIEAEGNKLVFELGSGSYQIKYEFK